MRDVNTAVASGKHEKHLLKSLQNAIRMGVCCVDRMEVYFYTDSCLYLRRQRSAMMLAHLPSHNYTKDCRDPLEFLKDGLLQFHIFDALGEG